MAKVTWTGENGGPDSIEQYGFTFPRGKAVDVPNDFSQMKKFIGNAAFTVEGAPKAPVKAVAEK